MSKGRKAEDAARRAQTKADAELEARTVAKLERRVVTMKGTFTEAASLYDLATIESSRGDDGDGGSAARRLMRLISDLYAENADLRAQRREGPREAGEQLQVEAWERRAITHAGTAAGMWALVKLVVIEDRHAPQAFCARPAEERLRTAINDLYFPPANDKADP